MPRVTVRGAREHTIVCGHCGHQYTFQVVREATLDSLSSASGLAKTNRICQERVDRMLSREMDPVACPSCRWISSEMVVALRRHFLGPVKVAYIFMAIAGAAMGLPCLVAGLLMSANTMGTDWFGIAAVGGGITALGLVFEGIRRLGAALRYPASGFAAKTAIGQRQLIDRPDDLARRPASAADGCENEADTPASHETPLPMRDWGRRGRPVISLASATEVRFRFRWTDTLGLAGLGLPGTMMGLAALLDYVNRPERTGLPSRMILFLVIGPFLLILACLSQACRWTIRTKDGAARRTLLGYSTQRIPFFKFRRIMISVFRVPDRRYEVITLKLEHGENGRLDVGDYPTYSPAALNVTRAAAAVSRMMKLPVIIEGQCTGPNRELRIELAQIADQSQIKAAHDAL